MRYSALVAAALIAATTAVPALAQDRTPPAGSLRALEAPVDQRGNQFNGGFFGLGAPFVGRSVYRSDAPDLRDRGITDGR